LSTHLKKEEAKKTLTKPFPKRAEGCKIDHSPGAGTEEQEKEPAIY
jgi:hypothetical protein